MAQVSPGRQAAARTLAATGRGRRLDLAFEAEARGLDARERGFARALSYGTVRLRGRLDHLLAPHVRRGIETLDPPVLDVLRLGLFQVLYLEVPDYAAVSQAVEMSRARGRGRAAGLVNAVLRAAARAGDGPDRFPDPDRDPGAWLAAWGSHPRWLVDRWLGRWPVDEVARLVEANNRVPPLYLAPLDGDLERAVDRLGAAGFQARSLPVPGVVELGEVDPAAALEAAPGYIQDPGAALVCRYAAPRPGCQVADLCAAPGGKALSLARTAGYVLAADRSERRLGLLAGSVRRTGLPIGLVVARAESPPVSSVDLLLLDVPCTGTGTLRRHPDARWRLTPEAPAEMARVQRGILAGSASVVRTGGHVVYSTCTLEAEENRGVVDAFMAEHPEFRPDPVEVPGVAVSGDGWLEVLPQHTGFDGAFAARLVRTS